MTFWCTAFQIFCRFLFAFVYLFLNLPRWLSSKESACQCRRGRRHGFNSWVGKMPWRRKWQLTPVFLLGKSHWQRSLAGYSLGSPKSWPYLVIKLWSIILSYFIFKIALTTTMHFFLVYLFIACLFYSVLFSCSVVSDSLRPHESQHSRPPCPSPTPGVH